MSNIERNIINEAEINERTYHKVTPHDLMHMNGMFDGIGTAAKAGAGAAAAAGVAGGKAIVNGFKKATTKGGAKKVYKRIEELAAYITEGQYPEKFKISIPIATKDGSKTASTIKSYDDILTNFKEEIQKDLDNYNEHNEADASLNDTGSLTYIVDKYKKLFVAVNKDFPDVKTIGDEDFYTEIRSTCNSNLSSADTYIAKLIDKFEKKFTIKHVLNKENEGNVERVQKWSMVLKSAWENKKKDIKNKYQQLPRDIVKSAEFVAMNKLVQDLYEKIPNSQTAIQSILDDWSQKVDTLCQNRAFEWYVTTDARGTYINIDKQNSVNNALFSNINALSLQKDIIAPYNRTNKTSYNIISRKLDFVYADNVDSTDSNIGFTKVNNVLRQYKIPAGVTLNQDWVDQHVYIECYLKLANGNSSWNSIEGSVNYKPSFKEVQAPQNVNQPQPQPAPQPQQPVNGQRNINGQQPAPQNP